MEIRKKNSRITIFYVAVIIVLFVLFVIKALLVTGITTYDEAHQIAVGYRFWLGDAPLVDDWSPEQLHGLVLLPFISLFMLFSGSTEGLFLFLRITYEVIKATIAIWGFLRLRNQYNNFHLITAIGLWYFFSPYNMENITYQSSPLILLMCCMVILADRKSKRFEYIFVGLLFAFSVLAQPYWVLGYVAIWIHFVINRKNNPQNALTKLLFFHLGLGVAVFYFSVIVFSRASLREVIANFPYILSEPDHVVEESFAIIGMIEKVYLTFRMFAAESKISALLNALFILFLLIVGKKRERYYYLMPIIMVISLLSMLLRPHIFFMNEMLEVFLFLCLENFFFVRNKKLYVEACAFAIIFIVATAMGTNTATLATSASISILAIVVIMFLPEESENIAYRIAMCIFVCTLFFFQGYNKTVYGFGKEKVTVNNFKVKIEEGPLKGLYCSDDSGNKELLQKVEVLNIRDGDKLFVATSTPMIYLAAQTEYATMGTPFFYLEYSRVEDYFRMHPDKEPTVIFFNKLNEENMSEEFVKRVMREYEISESKLGVVARKK